MEEDKRIKLMKMMLGSIDFIGDRALTKLENRGIFMRKILVSLIGAALLIVVLGACSEDEGEKNGDSGKGVNLQLGHALSEGTPAAVLIDEMVENVKEKTDGRVTFDVFPNSQLGSETEMLEQVKLGTMGSAGIMVGTMQTLDPKLAIEDLPYMWKDIEHARDAYQGEFGDSLAEIIADQGMTKFGYLEWGYRHITNNKKPIVKPEDMKGMQIRVAETKLRVDAFKEIGALPTVLAFSELYGALQQGTVDAQENPLANIVAPKFYEVQDYVSLTGHFYNTIMLVISTDVWEKISEDDQKVILEEAERIQQEVIVRNDEKEDEYIQILKENGMEVNDNVDKEAFRDAMLPVYDKWEKDVFGEELMDTYREASGW